MFMNRFKGLTTNKFQREDLLHSTMTILYGVGGFLVGYHSFRETNINKPMGEYAITQTILSFSGGVVGAWTGMFVYPVITPILALATIDHYLNSPSYKTNTK
jgi:hypothetical protein